MKHFASSLFSRPQGRRSRFWWLLAVGLLVVGALAVYLALGRSKAAPAAAPTTAAHGDGQAVLTVNAVQVQPVTWPQTVSASGGVFAWQESVISTELSGVRLLEVLAHVGDRVQRGQVLARFASDGLTAEVTRQEALVEEAQATLSEARANAQSARQLGDTSGVLSSQQITQYLTAEQVAQARLKAARAALALARIQLGQTEVRAPDSGVISTRLATLGTVSQGGAELFRLIRQGRLEWRAALVADLVGPIKSGQTAQLQLTNGNTIEGRVRLIGPTLDPANRNATVYVDLPANPDLRVGQFVHGVFELGSSPGLALDHSGVVSRDGHDYVFRINPDQSVSQVLVTLGRRRGELVEITSGVKPDMRLVGQGAGFLADGDTVKVAATSSAATVK